jgi:D-aminopeptidase
VTGVRVGQTTLVEGTDIRTGVTAVVPDQVDQAGGQLPAGLFVGNGYGKLIGVTQLVELGVIETPIVLTGTLSAFRAADALVSYMLRMRGNEALRSVNPVVGETNDGYLSDIRARPVTQEHVIAALAGARDGPVAEGAVGAGTGTAALGFKAGIGTASRRVMQAGGGAWTIGVIVQANFSGTLTVRGVRIHAGRGQADRTAGRLDGNSCMIVLATDAALDSRQLGRVARRAVFALGRTGSDFAGSTGDYAIAFATRQAGRVPESALGPIFAAAQDVVQEAILNSVFMATTTVGYLGHVARAVPLDHVVQACRDAGVLQPLPARSPRVDQLDPRALKVSCVPGRQRGLEAPADGGDLSVAHGDRVTGSLSVRDDRRVMRGRRHVERVCPPAEIYVDQLVDRSAEQLTAPAVGKPGDSVQQLGDGDGRGPCFRGRHRVGPAQYGVVGLRPGQLGQHVGVEDDHSNTAALGRALLGGTSSSAPPSAANLA